MNLIELNQKLVDKAESALTYLYKDAGKFAAGRFTIGNVNGDPGDSLFYYISSGRFKDSSTGDRGDLLELFCLRFGSKQSGIDAAYSFLGIVKKVKDKKVIAWKKPERDWSQLTENPAVLEYLTEERKIPVNVLNKHKIKGRENKAYTFLTYTHDAKPVVCGANYIYLKRIVKDDKAKKKIHQSLNPLATLWGHPECNLTYKNESGHTFLIITEGQIDALSCIAQGFDNAVSVPFGVSADDWIENSWDFIMKFKEVYLFFDNDDAGQKGCEKAAKRIGYDRCKKVNVPAHYNDANEAHIDGYDLHLAVDHATEFKPSKLVEASELFDDAIARMSKGRRELQGHSFLGWKDDDCIDFRIRPKEMTIYTGFPSSGKSNILYQETAQLVFQLTEGVVVASLEEDAEDILGLIMVHALGIPYDKKQKNVVEAFRALREELKNKLFFYHHRNRAPFAEVLQTAEYTIRKHGAKHFIMDSVAKTDLNIENNEQANEFVGSITTSMNDTGAHYHLVAHARKGPDKNKWEMPGMQEIKGANAFGVETFNVLSLWRDPHKTEMMQEIKQHGFYTKKVWDKKEEETGKQGFKGRTHGPSYQKVYEDEVKEHCDAVLWVCKQKVGGMTGKFDIFYNRENNRITRKHDSELAPYAKEIYDCYILGKEEQETDF